MTHVWRLACCPVACVPMLGWSAGWALTTPVNPEARVTSLRTKPTIDRQAVLYSLAVSQFFGHNFQRFQIWDMSEGDSSVNLFSMPIQIGLAWIQLLLVGWASNAAIAICDVIASRTCSHNWLTFPFLDLIIRDCLSMLLRVIGLAMEFQSLFMLMTSSFFLVSEYQPKILFWYLNIGLIIWANKGPSDIPEKSNN